MVHGMPSSSCRHARSFMTEHDDERTQPTLDGNARRAAHHRLAFEIEEQLVLAHAGRCARGQHDTSHRTCALSGHE